MLSRKGVSPIIASVLIILVVVALAGTYTVWSSRIFGEVAEEGEETVSRTTRALFSDFDIQGAAGSRIFIKNVGGSDLSASGLEIFYDGEPITFIADFDILEKDDLGTLTLQDVWKYGPGDHTLRVQGGSFSDSTRVTANPSDGVVADWRFDEGSGTTARDSSNNNDGTLTNGPKWVAGKFGKAIEFDGTDDYVDIPMSASLNLTNTFTMESWIRTDQAAGVGYQRVLAAPEVSPASEGYTVLLHTTDSKFRAIIGNETGDINCYADSTASTNTWYHWVVVSDGINIRHYIDGKPDGTSCQLFGSLRVGSGSVRIGRGAGATGQHFNGIIDEVRIYNVALSPEGLYDLSIKS